MNNRCATYILLTLVMLLTCVPEIMAQRFSDGAAGADDPGQCLRRIHIDIAALLR